MNTENQPIRGNEQTQLEQQRSVAFGLFEVHGMLGQTAAEVLSAERTITGLTIERFQSPTFRSLGYHFMEGEIYGNYDRSLAVIQFQDGGVTYVASGKTGPGALSVFAEMPDMRLTRVDTYEFDGKDTVVVRQDGQEPQAYSISEKQAQGFHQSLRDNAGVLVASEDFQAGDQK